MSQPGTGDVRAWCLAVLAVTVFASAAFAEEPALRASLEPREISLGETAELTITVTGAADAPALPRVDGLEIQHAGESTQIQVVNGHVSRSTSFLYQVRPLRSGSFTFPALAVANGSTDPLSSAPLALQVLPPSSAPRAAAPSGSGAPDPGGEAAAAAPRAAAARFELVAPGGDLYVGQLERVALRLLIPDGVRLSEVAPPSLSGAGFTISALANEHPRESREVIDDVPTTVLTWSAAVSAVKPGPQRLDAKIDGVLVAKSPSQGRRPRGGLFDDEFFGGSLLEQFFGGLRQQPIHLASQPLQVDVKALPEAGRPADFDGAVGEFRFAAEASPARTTAGDPVTLSLRVEGRGNFDRVRIAGLESGAGFKTYTPTARFESADPTGLEGRKVFEQTIIPEGVESASVPPQHFSYFDPQQRTYVTLRSDALPLVVARGGADPAQAASGAEGMPEAASVAHAAGVLALRTDLGRLRHDRKPLFLSPTYRVALLLPLLTLSGVGLAAWRRRRRLDPARLRVLATERSVEESLRAMEDALMRADARTFHAAARRALQARLAHCVEGNPAALTAADVEDRLVGDPRLAASVRRLLEEADAFAFAASPPDASALAASRDRILDTLEQLEARV